MTDYTNVATRAMLVSLHISTWSGRKFDKKATDEVNTKNEADARAGRYNKDLLVGAQEHQRVLMAAGSARAEHYVQTLPWSDEGWSLLPTENYMDYTKRMRVKRAEFDLALAQFAEAYPRLREMARKKLGKLWEPSDYPKVEEIRGRFAWDIDFKPVPSAGDLRVSLPKDQIQKIEAQITAKVEASVKEAMTDAWARLYESVVRIKDRLSEDKPRIYDSLIGNAADIVQVLARLNVARDEKLEKMRKQVERDLALLDPDDFRGDEPAAKAARKDAAKRAAAIVDAMTEFYSPNGKAVKAGEGK